MTSPQSVTPSLLERALHKLQQSLLWLLLSSYALGALWPGPGTSLRKLGVGELRVGSQTLGLSAPMLMLAFLLFNAGLGARVEELRHLIKKPAMAMVGLLANTALPVLYAFAIVSLMRPWPEVDETQNILVGLALIGAMPIAGASTAWAQNAQGNLALSLGLVLASTVLSPILTPVVLNALSSVATGEYADAMRLLAESGTQLFLAVSVAVPSFLGLAVRRVLPPAVVQRVMPTLKLLNLLVLLSLNYSNAALALPGVLREPDYDFLAIVAIVVALLCGLAFATGARLARLFHGTEADVTSLMFGLGMNNNGTGLVLASTALSAYPAVTIPILMYNLVQQVAAGLVDAYARRRRTFAVTEASPARTA
ncbi:MAG: bile acid:sodium symporter [Myxococcales bacterium]